MALVKGVALPVALSISTWTVRTQAATSWRSLSNSTRNVKEVSPIFSTEARAVILSPGRKGRKNSASARRNGAACCGDANQFSQPTFECLRRFSTA